MVKPTKNREKYTVEHAGTAAQAPVRGESGTRWIPRVGKRDFCKAEINISERKYPPSARRGLESAWGVSTVRFSLTTTL